VSVKRGWDCGKALKKSQYFVAEYFTGDVLKFCAYTLYMLNIHRDVCALVSHCIILWNFRQLSSWTWQTIWVLTVLKCSMLFTRWSKS